MRWLILLLLLPAAPYLEAQNHEVLTPAQINSRTMAARQNEKRRAARQAAQPEVTESAAEAQRQAERQREIEDKARALEAELQRMLSNPRRIQRQ